MTDPSQQPLSPIAQAVGWVARITTVALEMVLPGLAGYWLDQRLGTGYLVGVGFVLGFVTGVWHLLTMTGAVGSKKARTTFKQDAKDGQDAKLGTGPQSNDPPFPPPSR